MFNPTQGFEWQQCMDTCPKLRRSRPPTFINMEDMEEFFRWSTITTKDPSTLVYYPDVDSEAFWLPIRQVGTHIIAYEELSIFYGDFRHLSRAYFLCYWAEILICWCQSLGE